MFPFSLPFDCILVLVQEAEIVAGVGAETKAKFETVENYTVAEVVVDAAIVAQVLVAVAFAETVVVEGAYFDCPIDLQRLRGGDNDMTIK